LIIVDRSRSEIIGVDQSLSIRVDWSRSESIRVDRVCQELVRVSQSRSESVRVGQSRSESIKCRSKQDCFVSIVLSTLLQWSRQSLPSPNPTKKTKRKLLIFCSWNVFKANCIPVVQFQGLLSFYLRPIIVLLAAYYRYRSRIKHTWKCKNRWRGI
jgi:hypothetical protein